MLTLRQAADLLRAGAASDGMTAIAAALGCTSFAPLDTASARQLGLDGLASPARIGVGPGAIRALLLELNDSRAMRDALPAIAARLARRAPHVLWLVIADRRRDDEIAIAAWSGERSPPRVRALLARRASLVDSDAETLRALAAAAGPRDVLVHARWVEILGREALSARFYRGLESAVRTMADSSDAAAPAVRAELALLDASRLLFLCFLEAKGWLAGDRAFLANQFERCLSSGGGFRRRVLRPLFFGCLNTPRSRRAAAARRFGNIPFLNGGLFSTSPLERSAPRVKFSDDGYGSLIYDLFGQYRFTAAEESARWTEAAVDPEMLGRAFESLMAARERQRTGAFFTPFALVERVTSFALEDAFAANSRDTIERIAVLDPACGSGAFLVHALERIAARLRDLGDERPVSAVRRDVLTRSIFGVDVNPTAVWLCQLRLWLSVVIEADEDDPARVAPLPNLDRNVRVGDALSGSTFDDVPGERSAAMRRLRERYARATGARKRSLSRELDRAERVRAIALLDERLAANSAHRRDLVVARRGRDLFGGRYRPSRDERDAASALRAESVRLRADRRRLRSGGALAFSFPTHFADVAGRDGFDVVIGNPPWVRLHNIPPDQRASFRAGFAVARGASWGAGAGAAGAGSGFGAQVDLAALFVERSIGLLNPRGTAALLLPAKLWRSLAGGGVRQFIASHAVLRRIEDHSLAPATFDAAVYPSLLVAGRSAAAPSASPCVDVAVHHRGHEAFSWRASRPAIPLDDSAGAPWILLPGEARRVFDLLRRTGTPLAESSIGRPLLGVKCGCNDAFVLDLIDEMDDLAIVEDRQGTRFEVERALVRPLLRGEGLRRWQVPPARDLILWTHDALDAPLAELPPLAARWLRRWRRPLADRSDARRVARWWSLFRTEAARSDRPRVIWNDVGREPRASVQPAGDPRVPLNSCYVARCPGLDDAHALAALLNGPVARAWLDAIAEPARGGYHRYLGWTLAILPLPADWPRARALLAPLAARGASGDPPSESDLLDASLAAYEITRDEAAPLVAWMSP